MTHVFQYRGELFENEVFPSVNTVLALLKVLWMNLFMGEGVLLQMKFLNR